MCHGSLSTCVSKSGTSQSCVGPVVDRPWGPYTPYGPIYMYSNVVCDIPILPLIQLPLVKHRIVILVTSSIHIFHSQVVIS